MSSNVFMQKFFAPITTDTVRSAWYVDEFGAVPAFAATLVALYFWRKGAAEFSFRARPDTAGPTRIPAN